MMSTVDRLPTTLPVLALLLAALATQGCADKANPVLPSTGGGPNPSGVVGGEGSDAGEKGDSLESSDAQDVPDSAAISDAASNACDPLKQDCANHAYACYPVSGAGRCLPAGGTGALGTCYLGEDPPSCAPGYACMSLSSGSNLAACLSLCDRFSPTPDCPIGYACQLVPGFPQTSNVGFCQPA
jgi:hypothetical protein